MGIPRLFDFKARTLASADQVDAEFDNVIAAIEGVAGAAGAADVYQKGVVASTDWNPVVVTYASGGTLAIKTALGGAAWLPGPGGSLVRTFTPPQEWLGIVPSALPAVSGYMGLGFEISAVGSVAQLHVVVGPERGTSAEALAALPAPAADRVRINDQTIFNKAGTYEWGKGLRDRRPWALGARSSLSVANSVQGETEHNFAGLTQRVECSGRPVQVQFRYERATGAGVIVEFTLRANGATILKASAAPPVGYAPAGTIFTPAAGSVLFEARTVYLAGEGSKTYLEPSLSIAELLPLANNGAT